MKSIKMNTILMVVMTLVIGGAIYMIAKKVSNLEKASVETEEKVEEAKAEIVEVVAEQSRMS